jgi:hypothetical protein
MVNADTDAEVRIIVDGNMENLPLVAPEDNSSAPCLKEQTADNTKRMWGNTESKYDKDEKFSCSGTDSAWQWVFKGTELPTAPGQKVRQGEQQMWQVLVGGEGIQRTYQILCMCDPAKFDENKPSFEKIVASFKMLR